MNIKEKLLDKKYHQELAFSSSMHLTLKMNYKGIKVINFIYQFFHKCTFSDPESPLKLGVISLHSSLAFNISSIFSWLS